MATVSVKRLNPAVRFVELKTGEQIGVSVLKAAVYSGWYFCRIALVHYGGS